MDVAVGVSGPEHLDALAIGGLISRLEEVAGRPVDLVLLDEAAPGLAYRIFRDGRPILVRDRRALVARRAAAIILRSERLGDLLEFCDALAGYARSDRGN